jgi:hypothetical protein
MIQKVVEMEVDHLIEMTGSRRVQVLGHTLTESRVGLEKGMVTPVMRTLLMCGGVVVVAVDRVS